MKPLLAALFVLPIAANAQATDPQWQPVATSEAAARTHVQTRGVKLGPAQRIEAGPLDARIRLTQCTNELSTTLAPGVNVPPRLTVEVRCPGSGGWKVYVP